MNAELLIARAKPIVSCCTIVLLLALGASGSMALHLIRFDLRVMKLIECLATSSGAMLVRGRTYSTQQHRQHK
jgi:hypothetical protein